MKNSLIIRGILLGEDSASDIAVRNGKVVSVTAAGRGHADLGSKTAVIAPTLFDIQVNGACGVTLQGRKVAPEDVRTITDALARGGVSRWIPTLITAPFDAMRHGCRMIAEARRDPVVKRAVPGVHLEGPYISPMDGPRGAHPRRFVRKPSLREFDALLEAAEGRVIYTTVAPEIVGALPFIKAVVKRGVIVSLGHHAADADAIARAVDAGATLCTHLGNGLMPQINRHHNPLWPQLADDRLAASFIADLEHLPAPMLKTLVRVKGPERVIFTSDAVHLTGLKPGRYELFGSAVELKPSGRICILGTELLAGSGLMLLQGVLNAAQSTDLTLEQAFASATTIPAKLFHLRYDYSPPRPGKPADFIVFDVAQSKTRWRPIIRAVFVNGAQVPAS